jgi:hypothetical protein
MKTTQFLKVVSWACLVMVGIPSVISFLGWMDLDTVQLLALIGTIGWFVATPFWMGIQQKNELGEKLHDAN